MAAKIFVNLPVEDLGKSIEFFKKLGVMSSKTTETSPPKRT